MKLVPVWPMGAWKALGALAAAALARRCTTDFLGPVLGVAILVSFTCRPGELVSSPKADLNCSLL